MGLTSKDGWRLAAHYQKPPRQPYLFLLLHEMGGRKEDWIPFSTFAYRNGYGYLALDLRGHGESLTGPDGSTGTYKSFRRLGTDNEWNQMVWDVDAAVDFLSQQGVEKSSLILMGAGVGANIALKSSALRKEIPMVVLLSPRINFHDVLTVNPMRVYGPRPILLAASPDDATSYRDTQLLAAIARQTSGPAYVRFVQARRGHGVRMLRLNLLRQVLQWVRNPVPPPELPSSPTGYPQVSSGGSSGTVLPAASDDDRESAPAGEAAP